MPSAASVAVAPRPASERAFRPIQYMGSKARLLDLIRDQIEQLDPARGRAIDLFSGSGVVAAALAAERPVTAVDVQEYARVLATAMLSPARLTAAEIEELVSRADRCSGRYSWLQTLLTYEREAVRRLEQGDAEPLCEIVEHGSMVASELGEGPSPGQLGALLQEAAGPAAKEQLTLTRHYGGVYFSYGQALLLDCLAAAVRELPSDERETGLAAVLGAASECVTSVGSHFAQPIRPRDRNRRPKLAPLRAAVQRRGRDPLAAFAQLLDRYARLPEAAFRADAVRDDYRAFLAEEEGAVSVVYADPPYTRDHYSRFYHVLETIAVGDDPEVSTVKIGDQTLLSRGLYRVERHQSPFCIGSQVAGAFEELFAGVRKLEAPLVVSYSPYSSGTAARPQPRLLTIEALTELASAHFREVSVRSGGRFSHSRFNSSRLNGEIEAEAETLLVCSP
jgi:adenine-specific DNA-methyltransferase